MKKVEKRKMRNVSLERILKKQGCLEFIFAKGGSTRERKVKAVKSVHGVSRGDVKKDNVVSRDANAKYKVWKKARTGRLKADMNEKGKASKKLCLRIEGTKGRKRKETNKFKLVESEQIGRKT